jgi:hypothetical protein
MSARIWTCALAMMTTTAAGAKDRLLLEVSPAMSFEPANLVDLTGARWTQLAILAQDG